MEMLFSLCCTVSKVTVFVGGAVLNRAEAVGKSPQSQTTWLTRAEEVGVCDWAPSGSWWMWQETNVGPVGSHLDHIVAQVKYRQHLLPQSFFLDSTDAKQKKKNQCFLFRYEDEFVEKLAFWQQHNRESDEGEHHQNDQQGDANALPVPVWPNRSNVLHNNRKNSCRQQRQKHNCNKLWLRLTEWSQNLMTPQCSRQRWKGEEKVNDSRFITGAQQLLLHHICLSVCLIFFFKCLYVNVKHHPDWLMRRADKHLTGCMWEVIYHLQY